MAQSGKPAGAGILDQPRASFRVSSDHMMEDAMTTRLHGRDAPEAQVMPGLPQRLPQCRRKNRQTPCEFPTEAMHEAE